jgi:hypothetical protein
MPDRDRLTCRSAVTSKRALLLALASASSRRIMFSNHTGRCLGENGMKCLIVYYFEGHWIGEEVSWKRSGSGTYRETSRIDIPQSKPEIEAFAAENRFIIEWRGKIPAEPTTAALNA